VATRLLASVRVQDTVAQLGGDEFVILIEEIGVVATDAWNKVAHIAEKHTDCAYSSLLNKRSCRSYVTKYRRISIFRDSDSGDELLKTADIAMYQAKAAGRDTVRFFDPDMQKLVERRAALEADLRSLKISLSCITRGRSIAERK